MPLDLFGGLGTEPQEKRCSRTLWVRFLIISLLPESTELTVARRRLTEGMICVDVLGSWIEHIRPYSVSEAVNLVGSG